VSKEISTLEYLCKSWFLNTSFKFGGGRSGTWSMYKLVPTSAPCRMYGTTCCTKHSLVDYIYHQQFDLTLCIPDTSATMDLAFIHFQVHFTPWLSQVASQIFISVITCCLWYMHPSYDVHTQGTWTLSKILFHGWHLATWWKIFTNF